MAARKRKLFCKKCFERDWKFARQKGYRTWENIQFVRLVGSGGVRLKCGNCGHEYTSYSIAAANLRRNLKQAKAEWFAAELEHKHEMQNSFRKA